MVMRIGGLASGINTDEIIQKLMSAERIPLDKMNQDRTILEWKRDGYREIYQKLHELDWYAIPDMKKTSTYSPKSVSSTNEGAVTATASANVTDGAYSIRVEQLATKAMNISNPLSGADINFDATSPIENIDSFDFSYTIYQEATETEPAGKRTVTVDVAQGDTLKDVLKKISDQGHVRAFYDETSDRVIFETTKSGDYLEGESEIQFAPNSFFKSVLKMDEANESGGTDAKFYYNNNDNVAFTSKTNSYTMNGVTFQFKNTTTESVTLSVSNNVDEAYDKIMDFVNKYNEIVELINKSQTEEKHRDYKPLTDEQKEDMSEKQIELWEEKAKSGLLRGDTMLTSGMFELRQSWYEKVENGGAYNGLTQIGITTSKDYMSGGKLEVNEDDLKKALRENPNDVYKLFVNNAEGDARGLINRLEDSVESMKMRIEERAGKTTSTLDNYTLGKRIKDLNTRITDFEDRLMRVENRYWRQFSAMEQAISRLNTQSAQLFSQFGGGM